METPDHKTPDLETLIENLSVRRWSTLAALIVLLWEYVLTSRNEFRYIWRGPITVVKIVYVFSRYFAIAVQGLNLYLVFGPLFNLFIHESVCQKWFAFLLTSGTCLMAALDLILMLRIYALYQKDLYVGILLTFLFIGQLAAGVVFGPDSIFDVPYDCICDTTKTHPNVIVFGISVWVTHVSLGILTAAKWSLADLGAPVVRLVTREGMWIFVIVCSMFATIVPYSFARQASKAHIVFGWPISLFSIVCCRIIMNMQTLNLAAQDVEGITSYTSEIELEILGRSRPEY